MAGSGPGTAAASCASSRRRPGAWSTCTSASTTPTTSPAPRITCAASALTCTANRAGSARWRKPRALAREVNEVGAGLAERREGRFGFFATLALPDVDGSLTELGYALDELG